MYLFETIDYTKINKQDFYDFTDKSIFTTIPWINYLLEDNPGSVPVIVRIVRDGSRVGYFTGLQIKKMGISIIGSPFPGWGTSWMGLDIVKDENVVDVYNELIPFLYKTYHCRYITVSERHLSVEEASQSFKTVSADSLQLSVDRTDEGLFKVFKTDCRNFIRQFERRGASIEIAKPDDEFVEHLYPQLIDVFDKQGMNPTWTKEKIKTLIRNLGKDDMVLCLQVKDPDGNYIASSIFPGYNDKFFFWAGASYRSGQHYRPNEYMIWTAIKYWRDRGAKEFDMVGVRDYKKKFGPEEIHYAIMEFSKPKVLIGAKNIAKSIYYKSLKWKHKKKKGKELEVKVESKSE